MHCYACGRVDMHGVRTSVGVSVGLTFGLRLSAGGHEHETGLLACVHVYRHANGQAAGRPGGRVHMSVHARTLATCQSR